MTPTLRKALVMTTLAAAAHATSAQIVFHEAEQYSGRSFIAERDVRNLKRFGFNDLASSVVVEKGRWEVCERPRFEGRCVVLRPGSYPSLSTMALGNRISSVRQIDSATRIADNRYAPLPQSPVTFYEHDNFNGASLPTSRDVDNFSRFGFNNNASSLIISSGSWEVCDRESFRGRCAVLEPGRYPSLNSLGLNDRVSSIRRVDRVAQRDQPTAGSPGVTFYERENFSGRTFVTGRDVADFDRFGFNDRASSAVVVGGPWQVCPAPGYGGRCMVLTQGQYPTLRSMGLDNRISSVKRGDTAVQLPAVTASTITFFEGERFSGQAYKTEQPIFDFSRAGLAGRARSAEVTGSEWEVCPDPRFGGQCMLLRPGRYPTLESMGLPGRISSVRASAASAQVGRPNERFYEANVTSVRAVLDTPEQRCWVDQEQARSQPNIPAAIVGALLGGVLGNQVGGGTGKDIATVGGVVAGAAVGARIGRGGDTEEVKRCEQVPAQSRTQYWDVTYNFRGLEHRVQMSEAPGQTVRVNERGELPS